MDKKQIDMLFLWTILTFMKFCGDYYDIYENENNFISNASWEILNRTFFNSIIEVSEVGQPLLGCRNHKGDVTDVREV